MLNTSKAYSFLDGLSLYPNSNGRFPIAYYSAGYFLQFGRIQFPFYSSMHRRGKNPSIQQTQLYDKITKIESKIIEKVAHLKREKPRCDCKHFQNMSDNCEGYDPSIDYYEKFWKGFLLNEVCYSRLHEAQQQLGQLQERIAEVEELFESHEELIGGKGSKRSRRPAEEVEKVKKCPYHRCFKSYGSEISLNLHIKLKHNGGNKTQREKAAELIWQAREKNKPIPTFYINLPPGFVQEYGRTRRNQNTVNPNEIYMQE